jgi:hypothetical protein
MTLKYQYWKKLTFEFLQPPHVGYERVPWEGFATIDQVVDLIESEMGPGPAVFPDYPDMKDQHLDRIAHLATLVHCFMKLAPQDCMIIFGDLLTRQLSGFNFDGAYMDVVRIEGEVGTFGKVKNGRVVELVCAPLLCISGDARGSFLDRTEKKANLLVFTEYQRDRWDESIA